MSKYQQCDCHVIGILHRQEEIDYGDLDKAIRSHCASMNLLDKEGFIVKCIQLFETTVVRHGLMLVGPTGSGKTKVTFLAQVSLNSSS